MINKGKYKTTDGQTKDVSTSEDAYMKRHKMQIKSRSEKIEVEQLSTLAMHGGCLAPTRRYHVKVGERLNIEL